MLVIVMVLRSLGFMPETLGVFGFRDVGRAGCL